MSSTKEMKMDKTTSCWIMTQKMSTSFMWILIFNPSCCCNLTKPPKKLRNKSQKNSSTNSKRRKKEFKLVSKMYIS